jgi:hypothetical protein
MPRSIVFVRASQHLLLFPMLPATLAQHACHSFHAAQAPRGPCSEDRMLPMPHAVCFNLYGIIAMAFASFRAAACTRWARAAYCTANKQFALPVPESCCSSQIHIPPPFPAPATTVSYPPPTVPRLHRHALPCPGMAAAESPSAPELCQPLTASAGNKERNK